MNGSEFVTATVSVPFSVFLTVLFFTASATVAVPFFCLTVICVKRTEPLIVTVRFLVFDREPKIQNVYLYTEQILIRYRDPQIADRGPQ